MTMERIEITRNKDDNTEEEVVGGKRRGMTRA